MAPKIIHAKRINSIIPVQPGQNQFLEVTYEPHEATEPPPPPPDRFGAHPDVEDLTFDLTPYGLPEPKMPRARLEEFGGRQGADVDNREAIIKAYSALSDDGGGTIDVSGAQYGIDGWLRMHNVKNVSIVGDGKGSGFVAMPRSFDRDRGRWGCLIELWGATGCQFRDFEVDLDDQPIGGLYHKDDDGTVFARVWVHNGGGTSDASGKPLAMIKGSGWSKNFSMIGCLVEDSIGDGGPGSGVRGYWGPHTRLEGALISNSIFRRCGHTGLAVNPNSSVRIEFVSSDNNAGAGIKTDRPEDRPTDTVSFRAELFRCWMARNGFWGVQAEEILTLTNQCRMDDHRAAWSTHNEGNFQKAVIDCEMYDCREAGIWVDSRDQNHRFGDLRFNNNLIQGDLSRAGVWFHPRNTRPSGVILINGNKIPRGLPVKTTTEIEQHTGTAIADNGPNGDGPRG